MITKFSPERGTGKQIGGWSKQNEKKWSKILLFGNLGIFGTMQMQKEVVTLLIPFLFLKKTFLNNTPSETPDKRKMSQSASATRKKFIIT